MSEHTPGPWYWKRDTYTQSLALAAHVIENHDGDVVALISYRERPATNNEHGEADARLIAEAPEMYQTMLALTRCLAWHVETQGRGVGMDQVVLDRARAIIAQVEDAR